VEGVVATSTHWARIAALLHWQNISLCALLISRPSINYSPYPVKLSSVCEKPILKKILLRVEHVSVQHALIAVMKTGKKLLTHLGILYFLCF
jgi:hypothetical protein